MILYLPAYLSRRICLAGTTTSNIQVKLSRHIVTYCSYLTPQSTRGVGSDLWYTSYIVVHTRLDYEHATSSLMLRTPDIVGRTTRISSHTHGAEGISVHISLPFANFSRNERTMVEDYRERSGTVGNGRERSGTVRNGRERSGTVEENR